jgi:hypothetical protein
VLGSFITAPPRHSVTESVVLPFDPQEPCMPLTYSSDPSLLSIQRPHCPKCQGRMMLARIAPGPAGSEVQTFECPKCEYVLKTLAQDPMKSAVAGWLNSGLRPPE